MRDYIDDLMCPIVRLHGSIEWEPFVCSKSLEPEAEDPPTSTDWIRHAASLESQQVFRHRLEQRKIIKPGIAGWIPAIAIPTNDKTFVCPSDHVGLLESLIPQVTGVLIIGWRGAETHFVNLLSQVRPGVPVFTVCGSKERDEETLQRLGPWVTTRRPFGCGFSEFTRRRLINEVIEAADIGRM